MNGDGNNSVIRPSVALVCVLSLLTGCVSYPWGNRTTRYEISARDSVYQVHSVVIPTEAAVLQREDGGLTINTQINPICRDATWGTLITSETRAAHPARGALPASVTLGLLSSAVGIPFLAKYRDDKSSKPYTAGAVLTATGAVALFTAIVVSTMPTRGRNPNHSSLNRDIASVSEARWARPAGTCRPDALPPSATLPPVVATLQVGSDAAIELPLSWTPGGDLEIAPATWQAARWWMQDCGLAREGALEVSLADAAHGWQGERLPQSRSHARSGRSIALNLTARPLKVEDSGELEGFERYADQYAGRLARRCVEQAREQCTEGSGAHCGVAIRHAHSDDEKRHYGFLHGVALCGNRDALGCLNAAQLAPSKDEQRHYKEMAGVVGCDEGDPESCELAAKYASSSEEATAYRDRAWKMRYEAVTTACGSGAQEACLQVNTLLAALSGASREERYQHYAAVCQERDPESCDRVSVLAATDKDRELYRERAMMIRQDLCEGNPAAGRPAQPVACEELARLSDDPAMTARYELLAARASEVLSHRWDEVLGRAWREVEELRENARSADARAMSAQTALGSARQAAISAGVDEYQLQQEVAKLIDEGHDLVDQVLTEEAALETGQIVTDTVRREAGSALGSTGSTALGAASGLFRVAGSLQRRSAASRLQRQAQSEAAAQRQLALARSHAQAVAYHMQQFETARESAESYRRRLKVAETEFERFQERCHQEMGALEMCTI